MVAFLFLFHLNEDFLILKMFRLSGLRNHGNVH